MRFYSFTNFMLSPIQQGIQPGHACVELFVKYGRIPPNSRGTEWKKNEMLYEWADEYKTYICLNGGTSTTLRELWEFVDRPDVNPFPYSKFHEDEQSLDAVMTSIGIVLPAYIYETAESLRSGSMWVEDIDLDYIPVYSAVYTAGAVFNLTQWEYQLVLRLNKMSLAK